MNSLGDKVVQRWFQTKGWHIFQFQQQLWQYYNKGYSGLLNAPTGSGKTYAAFIPAAIAFINQYGENYSQQHNSGLQLLWITPLRALSEDIRLALQNFCNDIQLPWRVEVRTGDTAATIKQKQKKNTPEVLIITPESIHLLFTQKEYTYLFQYLKTVVVDEWHELLSTKRGVQTELALSRLKAITEDYGNSLKIWGISATIGNLEEAFHVLLGMKKNEKATIIKAEIDKKITIESLLPDTVENFPWAGHLGIKMAHKVYDIIIKNRTTLVFTNTRAQAEIWYKQLLEQYADLAGLIALHHGSIEKDIRHWVENALHEGKLKAVICTSSLDLGVDFKPVETIIQIGGPKGVARFMQRAGRSGHQPHAISKIYFLPTHSLELIEAAALKTAVHEKSIEAREPVMNAFDVLMQYLITLAVGEGLQAEKIFHEISNCFSFQDITQDEFNDLMALITTGGKSLQEYDEYKKLEKTEYGKYKITSKRMAMMHRLSMGTIVGGASLNVKFISGGYLGSVEEYFASKLKPGDVFWFAGRSVEFIQLKEMSVLVKKTNVTKGQVPSWQGSRLPLTSRLSSLIRLQLEQAAYHQNETDLIELKTIQPLLQKQMQLSTVPKENELLIEKIISKEGCHVFIYPFEGRLVHEVMAALIAYRIGQIKPLSFSYAMNDYGFELLCDEDIPIEQAIENGLFATQYLMDDIIKSINSAELAKRKFRDIAVISGLVFQGMPGKTVKTKHLQTSSSLIFSVFQEYEPHNILLRQAYKEVMEQQIEESRLRSTFNRIQQQHIIIKKPEKYTPFCFPILVDRLREKISTEKLEDRVRKMQLQLDKS